VELTGSGVVGILNGGLDALESMRGYGIDSRSFDDLQITQGRKIQTKILQGVGSLVDEENITSAAN